jgi:hypothetical protein
LTVAVLSLWSVLDASPATAQPSTLITEGFSDATTVTEWTFRPDPDGMVGGGGIQWSASEGQPPGSLELVNPGGGSHTVRAFSICLPFGGDQPWAATVAAMPLAPVICSIDLVEHATLDCSDDRVGTGQGLTSEVQGQWTTLETERLLATDPADNPRAMRLELVTGNINQPPGSCVFDNIVVTGSTGVLAADASSSLSLALLLGTTVSVGLWLLRPR